MNKQANIFFIPTSIGGYSAEPQDAPSQNGYYQQLIYASLSRSIYPIEGFQVLGRQLAAIARHAYFAKQMNAVEQAAQLMLALPLSKQLDSVARYYQALCLWRQGDRDGARQSLERVAEAAIPQYRARALQIIGLIYHEAGEADTALPFYLAAGKAASDCDPSTVALSLRMTAVVRSIHGDHKQALTDLENLFPLAHAVGKYYPATYYDFLNSLAVELAEVGRIAEAEAACAIALASPFAEVHPNWAETRDEIALKRMSATPSVIAINRAPEANVSPQVEQQRQRKPSKAAAFYWFAPKQGPFQRTVICPQAPAAVTTGLSRGILDWMRKRVGPRAPPHSR